MKPSPIQLVDLSFLKTMVEFDQQRAPDVARSSSIGGFNFEGVTLTTSVGIEELEELPPSMTGYAFHISVDLTVDNEERKGVENQVFSPYLLDLRAVALVRVLPGAEKLGLPRDIAAVNGAGMLWSAFREQVANLTSRMPAGPAMLPTVHFHDLKTAAAPSQEAAVAPESQAKSKSRKKSAT